MNPYPKPVKRTKEEKLQKKLIELKEKQQKRIEKLRTTTQKRVKKAKEEKISDLKKKVQKAVNKYVLNRDKDLPCISCGATQGVWNAGHYIAQGSSGAMRYNLKNIHKQCVNCNLYKHGNLIEYRINLFNKIGMFDLQLLEDHRHDVHKWTREELLHILEAIKL